MSNAHTLGQTLLQFSSDSPLLARLILASVEVAVLAAAVYLLTRLPRLASPRFRAALWLLVLAKGIFSVGAGSPLPLYLLEAPAAREAPVAAAAIVDLDQAARNRLEEERALAALAEAERMDAEAAAAAPGDGTAAAQRAAAGRGSGDAASRPGIVARAASGLAASAASASRAAWRGFWSPAGARAVAGLWIVGVGLMALLTLRDFVRIARLRRAATEPSPEILRHYLEQARLWLDKQSQAQQSGAGFPACAPRAADATGDGPKGLPTSGPFQASFPSGKTATKAGWKACPTSLRASSWRRLCEWLSPRRPPRLLVSDAVSSPALVGVFRPVVLLPTWLVDSASDPRRIAWLLRHELMHWRLRDTLGLAVRRAAEILLYFHPAVWWAGRRWEEAMELACDRALLRTDADARAYAEQLYGVLQAHAAASRPAAVRAGLCATRTQIGRRIAALLTNPLATPARLSPSSTTLLVLLAVAAFSFGLGIHRPTRAQTEPERVGVAAPPTKQEIVKSTLDKFRTALLSFRIDNDRFPQQLPQLTTPTSYLASLPEDPFLPGQTYQYLVWNEGKICEVRSSGTTETALSLNEASRHEQPKISPEENHRLWEASNREGTLKAVEAAKSEIAKRGGILIPPEAEIQRRLQAGEFHSTGYGVVNDPLLRALRSEYLSGGWQDPLIHKNVFVDEKIADRPVLGMQIWSDHTGQNIQDLARAVGLDATPFEVSVPVYWISKEAAATLPKAPGPSFANGTVHIRAVIKQLRDDVDFEILADPALDERALPSVSHIAQTGPRYRLDGQTYSRDELARELEKRWNVTFQTRDANIQCVYVFDPKTSDQTAVAKKIADLTTAVQERGNAKSDGKPVVAAPTPTAPPPAEFPEPLDRSVLERIPAQYASQKALASALFDLQEKEKRPNALLYDVVASVAGPDSPSQDQYDLIFAVFKDGWSDQAEPVKPYLAQWQPAFGLIRKAATIDYAKGIGLPEAWTTPQPNVVRAQLAATVLCAEGWYLESQGKHREALEDHLAALKMGCDFGAPDTALVSHMIGWGVTSIATHQVRLLVTRGTLPPDDLAICQTRLQALDAGYPGLADGYRLEKQASQWFVDRVRKDGNAEGLLAEMQPRPEEAALFRQAAKDIKGYETNRKAICDLMVQHADTPWWQQDWGKFDAALKPLQAKSVFPTPSLMEASARWNVAKANLRMVRVATALELHRRGVDGHYPLSLGAVIPAAPNADPTIDPFSGKPLGYRLDADRYALWSIGPDSKDDAGALAYDPTNGTVSAGDILFLGSPASSAATPGNSAVPAPAVTPTVPQPVGTEPPKPTPAAPDPQPKPQANQIPEPLDRRLLEHIPPRYESKRPQVAALLYVQEKENRPNALLYYAAASFVAPEARPTDNESALIGSVLRDGWTPGAEPLVPYIESWQSALGLVRKGAALDYAKGSSPVQYPAAAPVPDLLSPQLTAKALCVEGRRFESQGRPREALENYLTVLTMGRDYEATANTLNSDLVAIAIARMAAGQIPPLLAGGKLSPADLDRCRDRLDAIERTSPPFAETIRSERQANKAAIDRMRKDKKADALFDQMGLDRSGGAELGKFALKYPDRFERGVNQVWDHYIEAAETPWWKLDWGNWNDKLLQIGKATNPVVTWVVPSYPDGIVRWSVANADLRLARVETGLEIHRLTNGKYPPSLDMLTPAQVGAEPVTDPFSGQPLGYRLDGDRTTLWSVGPDRKDDGGAVVYDPTNGTASRGDILSLAAPAKQPPAPAPAVQATPAKPATDQNPESVPRQLRSLVPEGDNANDLRAFVEALLEAQQKAARPDPLVYYLTAGRMAREVMGRMDSEESRLMVRSVLREGWNEKDAPLAPLIEALQPALAMAREGAALGTSSTLALRPTREEITGMLPCQNVTRALCIDAAHLGSLGRHREALDDCFAGLSMGRYWADRTSIPNSLMGIALSSMAATQVRALVASGKLGAEDLAVARTRLDAAEKDFSSVLPAFRQERLSRAQTIARMRKDGSAEGLIAEWKLPPEAANETYVTHFRQAGQEIDRTEADEKRMWDFAMREAEAPSWDPEYFAESQRLEATLIPWVAENMNVRRETEVRWRLVTAGLRLARVATGLELARQGPPAKYPASLDALTPAQVGTQPTMDPFSGKPLRYRLDADRYTLWSVGPDSHDDAGAVTYDPSNGTVSAGDVILQP